MFYFLWAFSKQDQHTLYLQDQYCDLTESNNCETLTHLKMAPETVFYIFVLIVGFIFLIVGGDRLITTSIRIAKRLNVSPALIGVTLVAGGTSLPELVSSAVAAWSEHPEISVSSVLGSNIFNSFAIVGTCLLVRPLFIDVHMLKTDLPYALLGSGLLFLLLRDLHLSPLEGLVLLGFISVYFFNLKDTPLVELKEEAEELIPRDLAWWRLLVMGAVGLTLLTSGAHFVVSSGKEIGALFGVSDRVIGLTVVAVGSGLPELTASVVATFKRQTEVALANVVGSNLINSSVVVGVSSFLGELKISGRLFYWDAVWMVASLATLGLIAYLHKNQVPRYWGPFFLTAYAVYIFLIS